MTKETTKLLACFLSGEIKSLEGSILDLRGPTLLDDILDKLPREDGLCHAYILPGKQREKKLVARYTIQRPHYIPVYMKAIHVHGPCCIGKH